LSYISAAQSERYLSPVTFLQNNECFGHPADDRLVAAEARLEVHRVQVRGDLVLAPLLPIALETLEARAEARRHLAFVVVRRREQPIDPLLALEDRSHPPADERDDDPSGVRDDWADDRLVASRVVLDLLVEGLGERGERILQVL